MADKTAQLAAVRALLKPPVTPQALSAATQQIDALATQHPDDPDIAADLAQIYTAQQESARAIAYIAGAVNRHPTHVPARMALVRCLSDAGRWQDAVPHARATLDLQAKGGRLNVDIHNLEAVSTLGTHALFNDDWNTARNYFNSVIEVLKRRFLGAKSPVQNFDPATLPKLTDRPIHKILYLPVEVKAREFEAKMLLALAAAERGFHVVFGRSWVLNFGRYTDLPPGIVLFKTLNAMDANNMAIARVEGRHAIAALDEEAFGRSDSARALRLNVAPLAVQTCDLVMIQGDAHRKVWEDHIDFGSTQVAVTGNPKTDLLAPQSRAKDLANAETPMILFCTMSGNVNPKGRSFARTMEQTLVSGIVNSTKEMIDELGKLLEDSAAFEIDIIPRLRDAVRATAEAIPLADIVVRPHPIENADLWRDKFSNLKNVRVETDGPLPEWLRQCDVIVHISGCGSGTEAALLGVPAIRFEGDGRARDPDVGLSSHLNIPARTVKDVISGIKVALTNQEQTNQRNALKDYLLMGDGILTSKEVAERLDAFVTDAMDAGPVPLESLVDLRQRRGKTFPLQTFHLQKFPDTPVSEVEDALAEMADRFGLSAPSGVAEIEDGVFLLTPAG